MFALLFCQRVRRDTVSPHPHRMGSPIEAVGGFLDYDPVEKKKHAGRRRPPAWGDGAMKSVLEFRSPGLGMGRCSSTFFRAAPQSIC